MMIRTASILAVVAFTVAGCATGAKQPPVEQDPVDLMLAQSAASVARSMRELSEASGASRVVVTQAHPAAAQTQGPGEPQNVRAEVVKDSRADALVPRRVEPVRQTIAARRAIIAVETVPQPELQPDSVNLTPPVMSTGVVAIGGLLSAPPAGLEKLLTVRWTGELEQLLAKIARETGWRLAESKGFRVAPVVISINAENRSAFDLLRDIGAIAGAAADIHVSSISRAITVQYPER